ncbi:amidohydrolase family protein [Arsenicicoccus dermatophilus]|uniref:amidohydrolase family protein n=1 Tax=Arsenicicoccus dermatophilus TaxID=1076331 RepID=UPI001F4C9BC0|nr:amidohydrolase family protein [Arsenicicoccus dermatophilus]MCH8612912.1 amidohydrolase family protein [Arsenicicoccus dermatophilus]
MSAAALHLSGPVLVGPEEVRDELWVVDGRVTFQRPTGDVETLAGWVLPGLVDAHCHVGLDAHGAVDAETAERQILGDRAAGTLLIRDAGSPADTRWIDDRSDLPVVIRAGRHIARTRRYLRGYADEVEPEMLVAAVREQAARGDGWVKLVGDWIDRDTGDLAPCWPEEVVAAAVAAAHEAGARVTAHCFGEEVLPQLARAGIDCVEHATGLRGSVVDDFARQGIAIVPTLVNIATFPQIAEPARTKFPAYHRHMLDLHAARHETVRAAHEAGVPVYVGTDAGGALPHGLVGAEARELRDAGLTPREVLEAISWGARRWLGRPGLEEGAPADLCVYAADPRADIDVLAFPRAVVLRGNIH